MSEIKTQTKSEVKKITIPKVGKLVLSDKVKEYIDLLHKKIGATEWSGMLFYKLIEGDIKSMKDLVFQSDFIYPRDIGSSSYTETTASGDVADAYDIYPDGIECSVSLVHSHHSMGCFFSNTDTQELEDNAKLYNYYISLIVNFDGKYCAKIAFPGKQKFSSTTTLTDSDGRPYEVVFSGENEVIFIGDLDVEYKKDEVVGEKWLLDKIIELQDAKKAKTISINTVKGYRDEFEKQWEIPFGESKSPLQLNSIAKYNAKKPTAKDLLAALIVCSPEADQYTDKTTFIAQDLKYNCEDEQFGAMTLEFIQEEFQTLYLDIFEDNSNDKEYLDNLNRLLKELMIYEKLYTGKWFFEELKELIETSIEEIKWEINLTEKPKIINEK